MAAIAGDLLEKIVLPSDLRLLEKSELLQVCKELRQFIIDEVSNNPGHFGASLGVVELTVALHYVFNTPYDQIVWDVGHQAYGHKILTGRRELFHTNRKYKGISGFPNISESEYDSFGVGHSSTSISAALGMAIAAKLNKEDKQVVAVIGDGSMTAGLAFEGLNNAGIEKSNILIILNDNKMAIDPNAGALKDYLLDITTSSTYNKFRNEVWNLLGKLNKLGPDTRSLVQKIEGGLKSMLLKQSNLFEAFHFRYFGPVDGHDINSLVNVLKDLKKIKGPKLLHIQTTKGKGFELAELHQTKWHHAPGKFNIKTGELIENSSSENVAPKYQDVFGHTLVELAEKNEKIVGITPAMPSGCSMNIMMKKMPDRAFDVGIAEQHAVTFSAGLSIQNLLPFCNIYSSFMQRAYDQVIHDVALQNLNVVFCLDRAGLVGSDGATHHGAYDLAYMRLIPNLTIASPLNETELRNLMFTAQLENKGPFVIRYPRGNGENPDWQKSFKEIPVGKGQQIKNGNDIAILTIGPVGNMAVQASESSLLENISVAVFDMRFVKPIDTKLLHQIFSKFDKIITIEDGTIIGGFGSAILEFKNKYNYSSEIKILGIPDNFIEHGTQKELYKECKFDEASIINTIRHFAISK